MPEVPEAVRRVFVVSQDITAEEHVRMQAAIQAFVDNSISKTVNFPEHATVDDVKKAYILAWQLGCKGLTVYVTGSRQEVVLETKATAESKGKPGEPAATAPATAFAALAPARVYPEPEYTLPMAKRAAARRVGGHDLSQGDAAGHGLHHGQRQRRQPAVRGLHERGQGRSRTWPRCPRRWGGSSR